MASVASYKVYLAAVAGLDPNTWMEEQAYCQSISIRRGRDDYLQDYQPGSATLEFNNGDGRYSPDYPASALYGILTVGRAIWITATFNSITYSLFYGYIETITPHPMKNQQSCTVQCVDALARLALIKTTIPVNVAVLSGTQVSNILDAISWPTVGSMTTGKRDLDAGQSTFSIQYTRVTVLAQLQDIARNESGFCFAGNNGYIRYRDRLTRITGSPSSTSQGTFSGTMIDFQAELAARDIYNEVEVIFDTGPIKVIDPISASSYGSRSLTLQTQWIGVAEATDHANFVLGFRANPHTRGRMVIINDSDTVLTQILARELNDRITVIQTYQNSIIGDFFIEAIEHQITNGGKVHKCTWQLSPANSLAYWILGILNYTEVGDDQIPQQYGATRPAY